LRAAQLFQTAIHIGVLPMLLNRLSVGWFRTVAAMVSVFLGSAGLAQAGDLDFCHDEEWMTFEDFQS
jgi:hypothetical protein